MQHKSPITKATTALMKNRDDNIQQLLTDWYELTYEYNSLAGRFISIEQEVIRLRHENQFMIRLIEAQLNKEIQ